MSDYFLFLQEQIKGIIITVLQLTLRLACVRLTLAQGRAFHGTYELAIH